MTPRQFYEKVKEMRQAQKLYFKTKRTDYLRKSKELEKEIDREIERVENILSPSGNLNLFQWFKAIAFAVYILYWYLFFNLYPRPAPFGCGAPALRFWTARPFTIEAPPTYSRKERSIKVGTFFNTTPMRYHARINGLRMFKGRAPAPQLRRVFLPVQPSARWRRLRPLRAGSALNYSLTCLECFRHIFSPCSAFYCDTRPAIADLAPQKRNTTRKRAFFCWAVISD